MTNELLFSLASMLLFRILLDISLYFYIGKYYAYQFMDADLDPIKLLESYIALIIIFCLLLPKKSKKISVLVLQLFFSSIYLPFTSYYAVSNENRYWFYMFNFFWLLLLALSHVDFHLSITRIRNSKIIALLLCICACLIAYFTLFLYFGSNLSLSFEKVYDTRAAFTDKGLPTFLSGYFLIWIGKIIIPFLILTAFFDKNLFKKRRNSILLFLFSILCEIYLYGITGNKVFLFGMVAVIGLGLIVRIGKFFLNLNLIFSILMMLGILSQIVFNNIWILYLIGRRTFFIPAQISFIYYDFFSKNPVYLAHSIFKKIVHYQYELPPAHLIGNYFFGNPERSVNTGIIADGYMNFGIFGIILWAIILILLLKLADLIAINRNNLIAAPLMLISFYNLTNCALLSTILTHGLFLSFLIVYCLPKKVD